MPSNVTVLSRMRAGTTCWLHAAHGHMPPPPLLFFERSPAGSHMHSHTTAARGLECCPVRPSMHTGFHPPLPRCP